MKKIIVLVARGKGRGSSADFVRVKLFNSVEEANTYIKSVNDLESKYWTYAEIVSEGVDVEPIYGEFY